MKLAEAEKRILTLENKIKAITAILTGLQIEMNNHTHSVTISGLPTATVNPQESASSSESSPESSSGSCEASSVQSSVATNGCETSNKGSNG